MSVAISRFIARVFARSPDAKWNHVLPVLVHVQARHVRALRPLLAGNETARICVRQQGPKGPHVVREQVLQGRVQARVEVAHVDPTRLGQAAPSEARRISNETRGSERAKIIE